MSTKITYRCNANYIYPQRLPSWIFLLVTICSFASYRDVIYYYGEFAFKLQLYNGTVVFVPAACDDM